MYLYHVMYLNNKFTADLVINQAHSNPFENFCFGSRSKETQRPQQGN
jgi:hypothetical protein